MGFCGNENEGLVIQPRSSATIETECGGSDKALGPCPLHLTTFDLTRHGIFISGQAYQSLPQVLLELEGDDIYAVGMFGLIYGRFDNLQG